MYFVFLSRIFILKKTRFTNFGDIFHTSFENSSGMRSTHRATWGPLNQ